MSAPDFFQHLIEWKMNEQQLKEHRVRGEFKDCYDEAHKLLSTIKPEAEYGPNVVIDRIIELIKDMEDSYYLLLGHFEQRVIAMRKEIEGLIFANTAQANTIQSLEHHNHQLKYRRTEMEELRETNAMLWTKNKRMMRLLYRVDRLVKEGYVNGPIDLKELSDLLEGNEEN